MMKKILLFSALIASIYSCKEDDPKPIGNTGPGVPEQKYNALLLMGSDIQNPASAIFEASRLQAEYEYGDRLHTLHMVSTPMGPLYDADGDSIMMNFQSPASPFLVINGEEVFDPVTLINKTRVALKKKPLLAVTNKVSQNDTAWIIDHKVKFFMDTVSDEIYIDTYMIGSSKARKYATKVQSVTLDLRMAETQKVIKNPPLPLPNESQWDRDVWSLDTGKVLASKGSPFYYQNQFLAKFDSTGTWGYFLGDYWSFEGNFYENDIIGTNDTPIRHYFRKIKNKDVESPDLLANTEIRFMSIVWVRDNATGSFVHANSYLSPVVKKN